MHTGIERLSDSQDETRARLVAVARQCFEQHGIRKTRMAAVAEAAGIVRQTVYASVSSRERLIELALLERLRELHDEALARPIAIEATADEALVEALTSIIAVVQVDPEFQRYIEALGVAQIVRLFIADPESHALVREVVRPHFARAVAEGSVRPGVSLDDATWWVSTAMTPIALLSSVSIPEFRIIARRFILPGLLLES